ncbi:MAG TPA: hypothetical protein VK022_00950 [Paracoccaceae bacterium]|nr:hypothetical protein [Paracoccaceae bacterium]
MTSIGIINVVASGVRIHRWTVIAPAEPHATRSGRIRRRWLCRCDCGTEKEVLHQSLQLALRSETGGSRSCGCLAVERATRHGHAAHSRPSSEYMAWLAAKKRCANPRNASYRTYGGRGVAMCRRWTDSFEAFLEDLGPKPHPAWSLDRISPDGGYEPGNCRWAPPIVQSRNRRSTRWFVFEGQTCTIGEVARFFGITRDQARALERKGRLPVRRAETRPLAAHDLAAAIILDLNGAAPTVEVPSSEVVDLA